MADHPLVPALVGPTGSGKSAVAMAVAEALGLEIVAVDAFTVYRGMDIGTAKPMPEDRRRVRHHMVDVLSPTEVCSVEWFQHAARSAIDDVLARGATPLLVGGSGLYYRAVVDPLEFPPTDADVRRRLEHRYRDDAAGAHATLAAADPDAAARIDPANVRRTVRALEVIELTGRPFSDWRRAWDRWSPIYPGLRVVGIDCDRTALGDRIHARVDAMLDAGWLEEVRTLSRLALSTTAAQAIGYAELLDHLAGRLPLDDAVARITARTRQFAARQQRWFRQDPRVEWVDADHAPDRLRLRCTS
ncbi:MAG TPA: tRNA (adenosine(37)-N6)-dimethylallyltransferase MiaA [Egibacteraceae bacterium]|nr:tRNA (adenosine(37)-N6)-dimethylallyltransferase MiaA [Egibacteraceae bacterium]